MTLIRSLGFYNPPRWRAYQVGRDLTTLTQAAGLVPRRDPYHNHQVKASWHDPDLVAYVRRRTVKNPKAADWHQDGDLTPEDMDFTIVLWASNTPTEIRTLEGVKGWIKPREVVYIRNLSFHHRRPPDAPRVRWIFRQLVENV